MAGFVGVLAAFGIVSSIGASAADAESKPNIVLIMADDYGLDGVGCYGSDRFKDKTPNIDALAKTGARFETCYCTPLCGPTRCLLMTGRYGFRTGGMSNQTARNPSFRDEPSMARVIKPAGYVTGFAGKWRQMSDSPGDWGFDEYVTDPTASGYFWEKSYTKNGQQVVKDEEFYYPDVQQAFAEDFLTRHRNEPFFFYYASHLVHGPILKTPDTKPGTANEPNGGRLSKGALYADNVAYLDKQVGQLVAKLQELGIREKTLVVFTADNGTAGASATIHGKQINGAKGSMLEGGSRVALIASWPGTITGGRVIKDLVDFSDILPTFADLAGAKIPENVKFDGRSFAPQLRGEPGKPRDWIFVQLGRQWYVREPGWKLNQKGELFNMKDAPFIETLVDSGAETADAKAARQRLQAALDQLNPAGGKVEPAGAAKKNRKKKAN